LPAAGQEHFFRFSVFGHVLPHLDWLDSLRRFTSSHPFAGAGADAQIFHLDKFDLDTKIELALPIKKHEGKPIGETPTRSTLRFLKCPSFVINAVAIVVLNSQSREPFQSVFAALRKKSDSHKPLHRLCV